MSVYIYNFQKQPSTLPKSSVRHDIIACKFWNIFINVIDDVHMCTCKSNSNGWIACHDAEPNHDVVEEDDYDVDAAKEAGRSDWRVLTTDVSRM